MDIIAVIRDLLFTHDCVILPGFGGFIGNYSSARSDKATGTFYPPVKLISFNRNLSHDDGLLTATLSAKAGVSFNEARSLVDEFVADARRKLGRGEKLVFEGIGSFTTNSEGNYIFEPDRSVNFNLDSYGLTSFTFPPLEGFTRIRKLHTAENQGASSRNLRKYIWRAAVMAPIIGTLVAVPLLTDVFKTKVQTTSLNPVTAVISDTGSGNVKQNSEEGPGPAAVTVQATVDSIKPYEKANPAVAAGGSDEVWLVITGSFKSPENARILAQKLSEEGYSPEVSNAPNGFYRVSAVSCNSLGEAVKIKNELSLKYPGTWVKKGN